MANSKHSGTVTLTLEMPIEVAEWFAANGESIGFQARIAANKARFNSVQAEQKRKENWEKRKTFIHELGREGYRQLRKINGGKNLQRNTGDLKTVAQDIGTDHTTLYHAVTRFKKQLLKRIRQRRIREVNRLHIAGLSKREIAARYSIHPVTVTNLLEEAPKTTIPLAKGNPHSQGPHPESTQIASPVIPWDALKQAGRRI